MMPADHAQKERDRAGEERAQRKGPGIWRSPIIRLIFIARVASVAGDWVYQIALVWLVLVVTKSPLALSLVSLSQIVPLIAMSVAFSGKFANIVSPSRLVPVDILQALVIAAFPVLYWTGGLNLAWFMGISVIVTIFDSVYSPGLQALVPQLVDRHQIPAVHSLLDMTKRLGRILGPGFTSLLLLLFPIAGLFIVDSASFIVSALCLAMAARIVARRRLRRSQAAGMAATSGDQETPDGPKPSWRTTFGYVRENSILLWLFTVRNAQNLLWSVYLIGVPVLVQRTYHSGPAVWGMLIAVYAAGQLSGNWITMHRRGFQSVVRYVLIGWFFSALGFVGLGLFPWPMLGAACLFVGGAGSAAANVSSDSYVGLAVPTRMQPAAFSWQFSGNQITQLAGIAAFGVILSVISPRAVIIGTGLAMIAFVAVGALARWRWAIRQTAV